MNQGRATRIYKDHKDRYVVAWEVNRRPVTKTYAEYNTAAAIAARVQENGSPRRGFAL